MEPSPKRRRLSSKLTTDSNKLLPGDAEKSSLVAQDDWNKKELWIIQLPKDLDPTVLDGLRIPSTLDHPLPLPLDDDSKVTSSPLEVKVQSTNPKDSAIVMLPSTKPGALKCAIPKMFMSVQHAVDVPPVQITLPPRCEASVEVPHGLKPRYKPFGWRKPVDVIVTTPNVSTDSDSQRRHKHKNKHQNKSKHCN